MAGIDTITNEILQNAKSKADELIAQARQAADSEAEKARAEAAAASEKAAERAVREVKAYGDRIQSQIGMRKREAVLAARQSVIGGMIDAALRKLEEQDTDAYFAMLLDIAARHIHPEDGTVILGKKDLDRMPADFAGKMAALAKTKGGTLTVSDRPGGIGAGLILKYGGIEENCTLKALFADASDELQDTVNRVLW